MSFGEDQRMDMDADTKELLCNRKEEYELSAIPSISTEMVQALYFEKSDPKFFGFFAHTMVTAAEKAMEKFRIVLCNMPYPPIEQVIKSGAVPRFVHFLEDSSLPKLQLESARVLTKISTCGNSAQTRVIIESGAVPVLVGLLSSPIKNAEIMPHVCRALSSLSDAPNEQIQVIINSGVLPRAIQLLSHTSTKVVKVALDLVGAIARGDDSQAQVLINVNVLPVLGNLLFHKKESIVKKACWTLSNITAGNEKQIQSVMDSNLIPSILKLLHHQNTVIRIRAAWAIANATAKGSEEQILCIVEAGAIPPLCKLLSEADSPKYSIGLQKDSFRERYFSSSDLTNFALRGLVNILRTGASFAKTAGSTVNPFATLICNSPSMKLALYSEKTAIQLDAAKRFANFLRTTEAFNLLIDEVIRSGTVPRFVHFLEDSRYPKLQFESACLLIHITDGTSAQTQVVIDAGAVPLLVRLLFSPYESVVGLSVQILGNIACNSTESRDLVLNNNVLPPLLGLFNGSHRNTSIISYATWTLSCLCFGNPGANFKPVPQCLRHLTRLILNENPKVLADTCSALAFFGTSSNEKLQVVIKSGICPLAVQLLRHSSPDVVREALHLVLIIISRDDSHTQVVKANALPALGSLLSHENEFIVEEACCTLSRITAGNEQQIQAVIDCNFVPLLITLLYHGDSKIRQPAVIAIANATANGSAEQIVYLVEAGAIAPLCKLLSETDSGLFQNALICLFYILRIGKEISNSAVSTENAYATFIKQCGGFDKISLLSSHDDLEIREMALVILKMCFDSEGDDSSEMNEDNN